MSIEAMAIALHHSRAKGTAKIILIGIANHDGDGGAWPSMATLAKYGGCTADQARKLVRRLEALKEVETAPQAGGTRETPDHMRPNLYRFKLRCPADCDGSTQHRTRNVLFERAPELSTPPADSLGGTDGDTPTPYAKRRAEPSFNPPPLNKETSVVKRARASIAHTTAKGRPCAGELVDDRHCIFGCTIEGETP